MSNTYCTGAHAPPPPSPPPPPPPPSWRSAIFSSATDYSTQCVDRLRPGATRSAYRSVCFALKVSRLEKTFFKRHEKIANIKDKWWWNDNNLRPRLRFSVPEKRPQGCCCFSPARRTDASTGPRCCCSPRSCSVSSLPAPAFQVKFIQQLNTLHIVKKKKINKKIQLHTNQFR